ncbi:unnamed protein product [Rotaria sp. Silwood1]|nr:unnamed protein product [Rotaria sp. Silwood1]CAF3685578.1 unnamed protein product [Rotaria sp. Silwood1]CAF4855921.1 unnamed protein product [Rotaria sp. Silwood1]CAF4859874.1 unnamed protein product [Rotaria sp. Silwood1]CAF5020982.1 unnamed protein product [Rotaria sp. Silwood1]
MQSAMSLSSISSTTSTNSSTSYASRTILEPKDLSSAAPRCRSSIIAFLDNDQNVFPPSPLPPPPPPRRRSQLLSNHKSMSKCRHLFRICLSLPTQTKLSNSSIRKQYFAKLCHHYRLLLVLNDYECKCGCHFSMRQGTFVILYETKNELSKWNKNKLVTVISNELVCSKVPSEYVCDVELLRERVRTRNFSSDDEQSFDL